MPKGRFLEIYRCLDFDLDVQDEWIPYQLLAHDESIVPHPVGSLG